ncbi:MAG: aldose 1-epimerase family protein [Steroidobacteraceae bacterium]
MTTASAWLRLHSALLTAEIDPQGAQLSVLRDSSGRDLLWNGDPAFWSGRAPVLFPIVGTLNGGHFRWRGQSFALPRHGFARGRAFDVVHHDAHSALLRLRADAGSEAVYPFRFELDMAFELDGSSLTIAATVRNAGNQPMPASVGFHPAFRWPLPGGPARGGQFLEFEHEEPATIRRLDAAGLLSADCYATPVRGRRLVLDDALFSDDVVIFDQLASHSLVYGSETGPRIRVRFPDATHLGVWSKPGAGFVCIEPWLGVADPAGFAGDFDAKPGAFVVTPGGQRTLQMRIELLAAE